MIQFFVSNENGNGNDFCLLKAIKTDHVEKGTLTKDEERILDRYLMEYKHQGYELTQTKFDELNTNWMKRLLETRGQYNYRMMVRICLLKRFESVK